jgi:hypothetical protein
VQTADHHSLCSWSRPPRPRRPGIRSARRVRGSTSPFRGGDGQRLQRAVGREPAIERSVARRGHPSGGDKQLSAAHDRSGRQISDGKQSHTRRSLTGPGRALGHQCEDRPVSRVASTATRSSAPLIKRSACVRCCMSCFVAARTWHCRARRRRVRRRRRRLGPTVCHPAAGAVRRGPGCRERRRASISRSVPPANAGSIAGWTVTQFACGSPTERATARVVVAP